MNEQRSQLIARINEAKNILVTVSKDPSVDQLSAAIGFTIALNNIDKHATAVYSGETPSTIEFLKPDETLETTTDSLRDFIIALDKSKADKLRYKVEDQMVRIFITPYRTAISESDLDFTQGDFNVDLVVGFGVHTQQDIDEAVRAHGRILHDATVATLSTGEPLEMGSVNWVERDASSLSEMALDLLEGVDQKALDEQSATALLTGIVSTTDRFRNDKTTPRAMSASATLMSAGANQQLIANELAAPVKEESVVEVEASVDSPQEESSEPTLTEPPKEPGTLEIDHDEPAPAGPTDDVVKEAGSDQPQIHVDDDGMLKIVEDEQEAPREDQKTRTRIESPPMFGNQLSGSAEKEAYSPAVEELTAPAVNNQDRPTLSHNQKVITPLDSSSEANDVPLPPVADISTEGKTLEDLEKEVGAHSQQAADDQQDRADAAREAVAEAVQPSAPEPIAALNATPLGGPLHEPAPQISGPAVMAPASDNPASTPPVAPVTDEPTQPVIAPPLIPMPTAGPSAFPGRPVVDPTEAGQPAPPPVPPPMVPMS